MSAYLNQTTWHTVDQSETPEAFVAYLNHLGQSSLMADYRRRFLDLLPLCSGDRVLDVGCGIGSDMRLLAKRLSPDSITGVDLSRHMVRRTVHEVSSDLHCAVSDMCRLPFSSDHFNGAFCNRVLMHLDRPMDAVREMARVLKPGGWLALCEPDWSSAEISPDSWVARRVLEMQIQSYANGCIGNRLVDLVQQAGCRVAQAIPHRVTIHDLNSVQSMGNLDRAVDRAVKSRVVRLQDVTRWKQEIHRVDRYKAFGFTLTMHVCIGRKV